MPKLGSALRELERERARLSAKLNSIEKALSALKASGGVRNRRRLSAAALDRIRAAQKARWEKWRKAHKKA